MDYSKPEFEAYKHSAVSPDQKKAAEGYVNKFKGAQNARLRECGRLNEISLASTSHIHIFKKEGDIYVAERKNIGFVYAIDWIIAHRWLDEMIEKGVKDMKK